MDLSEKAKVSCFRPVSWRRPPANDPSLQMIGDTVRFIGVTNLLQ